MKVILLGNDPIFTGDILWGFESQGHETLARFPKSIEEYDQLIADFRPDMLMTFGSPSYYQDTKLLGYIGNNLLQHNIKSVHWDTDGITWVHLELNMINLLKPNIVFTVCPDMYDVLRANNITCDMLPYAFSPTVHYPKYTDTVAGTLSDRTYTCTGTETVSDTIYTNTPINEDYSGMIAFIGCAYPEVVCNSQHYRTKSIETLVKPLLQNAIRVDFWGDTRHQYVMRQNFNCNLPDEWSHGRCLYRETNDIYNSCFINIVPQNHENHLTKRTYEILGSGGFILTYDTTEIRRLFTPNKELVVSSSPQQTLELVKYYRNNCNAYDEIRKNAVIAAKNHSYKQRVGYIIDKIDMGTGTVSDSNE